MKVWDAGAGQETLTLKANAGAWSVARIAQHLECSNEAVAGLLKRGLKPLRDLLQGWE